MAIGKNQKQEKEKRLTRRERLMRTQKQQEAKNRRFSIKSGILTTLFLLGLVLLVLEIKIYRSTLIDASVVILFWLGTSLMALPLTSKLLSSYSGTPTLFLKFVYNVAAVGGTCLFAFMALNFNLAQNHTERIQVAILKTGAFGSTERSCANPYAIVEINGKEKQLVFPCSADVEGNNYVNLLLDTGLFGIPIIKGKELVKK